jgi:hypothetical protein
MGIGTIIRAGVAETLAKQKAVQNSKLHGSMQFLRSEYAWNVVGLPLDWGWGWGWVVGRVTGRVKG